MGFPHFPMVFLWFSHASTGHPRLGGNAAGNAHLQGLPGDGRGHLLSQPQQQGVAATEDATHLEPMIQGHAGVQLLVLGDGDLGGWENITHNDMI